eukprot:gene17792-20268_t
MVAELAHVVIRAALDSALRAVVLRGSAGFFSAGFFTADGHVGNFHSRLQAIDHAEGDPAVHRNLAFGHLLQAITALPMPVLAVVEGAAMGGGLGLACCADIVLATEDARFALSETGLGLIPAQIAPFVQARVGHREALRLGLSGERVSGTLAQSLGLVDALAADSEALDALQTAGSIPDLKQYSQEFRVESKNAGPMNWQAGVYYFNEDATGGTDNFNTAGVRTTRVTSQQKNTAWAAFGSVNYAVNDVFTVRGGLRYTKDKKDFNTLD